MNQISEILNDSSIGSTREVRGWVYRSRTSGKLAFIILRDSTNIIQCVARSENFKEEDFKLLSSLTIESSLSLSGTVKRDDRAVTGYELNILEFKIYERNENFPVSRDISEEFELDNRHLWIRSREFTSILKIRSTVFNAFRDYFSEKGYFEVQPPLMVSTATEGGSTLFKVPFFGEDAYLTQSSQFYLETFIFSLERVYTISPSFRAEKSRTWRHLTEYWHAEAELAWVNNNEMMEIEEEMIHYIIRKVIEKNESDLTLLNRDIDTLKESLKPFKRMKYSELIDISESLGMPLKYGDDLGADEEKQIMSNYKTPIFITDFPASLKTFYHQPNPEKIDEILCHDLLAPEGYGEIVGGGERIWDYKLLKDRIRESGLNEKDYYWYLDLRKYGSVPHSGFGLGMDRMCMWIMHLDKITGAIAYPRTIRRLRP